MKKVSRYLVRVRKIKKVTFLLKGASKEEKLVGGTGVPSTCTISVACR